MKRKNIFWSYDGPVNAAVTIEHTLKYEDVDAIKILLEQFGEKECRTVWEKIIVPDERFRRLNFFLAKFIFKTAKDDNEVRSFLEARNKNRGKMIYELFNR